MQYEKSFAAFREPVDSVLQRAKGLLQRLQARQPCGTQTADFMHRLTSRRSCSVPSASQQRACKPRGPAAAPRRHSSRLLAGRNSRLEHSGHLRQHCSHLSTQCFVSVTASVCRQVI